MLGTFARAFDVYTGETGPEIEIPGRQIVAAGPASFVLVENNRVIEKAGSGPDLPATSVEALNRNAPVECKDY